MQSIRRSKHAHKFDQTWENCRANEPNIDTRAFELGKVVGGLNVSQNTKIWVVATGPTRTRLVSP